MSASGSTDTIVALASGPGRAAVAVLRLSGPGCGAMLDRLCGRPAPRRASLRTLRRDGEVLDRALVLWMPGPGSYTGEDCAELQLHGGRAVLQAVSAELARLGARPAEPGEFTRRAVLNGRMDVLEAEGVADLVAAESEAQRRQALRQMEGGLSRRIGGWAERLRIVLAQQEALIDFPDEDLPPEVEALLLAEIAALQAEMRRGLDEAVAGERVRDGLVIAVVGPPDVGKSSLVNALAGREVAIVAAGPGTTRDILEATVEIAGVAVTLLDTAGLRETADPVEAEGVRRARARAASADLVIELRDARSPGLEAGTGATADVDARPAGRSEAQDRSRGEEPERGGGKQDRGHSKESERGNDAPGRGRGEEPERGSEAPDRGSDPRHGPCAKGCPGEARDTGFPAVLDETAPPPGAPLRIVVLNKADLATPAGGLPVSAVSGLGLDGLRARLAEAVAELTATGAVPLTRARHRAALEQAVAALGRAQAVAWPELRGEELRLALRAVGRITGQVDVEALLDTVFSRFCIGK